MAGAPSSRTARQAQIVACARELLEAHGIERLTVGRLAAELGIRAPSLYKHFAGKADLELRLIEDGLAELAECLEAVEAEGLGALARAYRDFARRNPQLYGLMTGRPLPRDRLPPGLEARAAAPVLRATGGDQDAARAAWAFAHGMIALELAQRFPAGADLDAAWGRGVAALWSAPARA